MITFMKNELKIILNCEYNIEVVLSFSSIDFNYLFLLF